MSKAKPVKFYDKATDGIGQSVNYAIQGKIPAAKRQAGSLKGKVPIYLDDGRTVVYASPVDDEGMIRQKYLR